MTKELDVHPAANLFPLMDAKAFREFVDDIKEYGLQDPIAVLPDGRLIDGRHRLRACRELGIEPQVVTVNPDSPTAYVVSKNKHRRHLNKSQLAVLAARNLDDYKAEAKERQRAAGGGAGRRGGDRRSLERSEEEVPQSVTKGEKVHVPYAPDRAQTRAARDFGVNAKYVQRAVGLLKHPEVVEKVEAGEMSIDTACAEVAKRTGKRDEILAKAAFRRAADFVGRIEGIPGYCQKANVDAIRSDERLRRHWIEATRSAIAALRLMLKQLEEE